MNKNRLKELRKSKKLTLNDLSDITGIKRATLSNYENGATEPKLETWETFSKFFGVSIPYLQGLSNIPDEETLADWSVFDDDKTIKLFRDQINEITNNPQTFNVRELSVLSSFIFFLSNTRKFPDLTEKLWLLVTDLEQYTEFYNPADAEKIKPDEIIDELQRVLDLIKQGWEKM